MITPGRARPRYAVRNAWFAGRSLSVELCPESSRLTRGEPCPESSRGEPGANCARNQAAAGPGELCPESSCGGPARTVPGIKPRRARRELCPESSRGARGANCARNQAAAGPGRTVPGFNTGVAPPARNSRASALGAPRCLVVCTVPSRAVALAGAFRAFGRGTQRILIDRAGELIVGPGPRDRYGARSPEVRRHPGLSARASPRSRRTSAGGMVERIRCSVPHTLLRHTLAVLVVETEVVIASAVLDWGLGHLMALDPRNQPRWSPGANCARNQAAASPGRTVPGIKPRRARGELCPESSRGEPGRTVPARFQCRRASPIRNSRRARPGAPRCLVLGTVPSRSG